MKPCSFVPTKKTPFIKTQSGGLLHIFLHQYQLPFPRHRSSIASTLHHTSNGMLLFCFWERSPTRFQFERIPSRHQSHPRRVTDRHAVTMVKPHATLSQCIHMRRFYRLTAIASNWFTTHIICENEQDIGWIGSSERAEEQTQNRDTAERKTSKFHCYSFRSNFRKASNRILQIVKSYSVELTLIRINWFFGASGSVNGLSSS